MKTIELNRFGRCVACNGTGLISIKALAYCHCNLGIDLERDSFRQRREEQRKRDEFRLKMEAMGL